MRHELKCIDPFFTEIWNGEKNFELRNNDRNFQFGDEIELKSYQPIINCYNGLSVVAIINYVLQDFEGLEDGYCILGISVIKKKNRANDIKILDYGK